MLSALLAAAAANILYHYCLPVATAILQPKLIQTDMHLHLFMKEYTYKRHDGMLSHNSWDNSLPSLGYCLQ